MGFLGFGKKKEEGAGKTEKRRYHRLSKTALLECRDLGTRATFSMETKDLGVGGVRFVCQKRSQTFRAGDTFSIRFSLVPEIPPTETIGKVAWVKDQGNEYEGGIEFLGLSNEQKNSLKSAIEKLKTGENFTQP